MGAVRRIREQKGVAFVCIWASGMNSAVAVALSPALPSIAREFGGAGDGAFIAQLIMTLPAIAMILGAALAGYASEWLGRRLVLLLTGSAFAITGTAGLFTPDLVTLAISRGLLGFASGMMVTTSYAVVAEYFDGNARNRMLGYCGACGALSTIVLLALAGPMVDTIGWRSIFILFLPVVAMIPFILTAMHRELPNRVASEPLSWRPILAAWPLWLLQIGYTIGMYMSVIQIPFVAAAKGIVSASTISLLVATTSAFATLVAVLHGRLRLYLDFKGMFLLMSLAFGLGLLISVHAGTLPVLMIGAALLGLGAGSVEPTIMSRALAETPEPLHDRAAGAAIAALFAGQFLNPVAVYPLAVIGGIDFALVCFAIAYLAAGGVFIVMMARRPRSGPHPA